LAGSRIDAVRILEPHPLADEAIAAFTVIEMVAGIPNDCFGLFRRTHRTERPDLPRQI
jgi:hypothetical protein